MIRNYIKSFNKYNYRNFSTNIIDHLCLDEKYYNHNCKYIRSIKITYNNPNHKMNSYRFYKYPVYSADIFLADDNIDMYKSFESNNKDDLLLKIKIFLNNEIKL